MAKIYFNDVQIAHQYSHKNSLVTHQTASDHNLIPATAVDKSHYGQPSASLLHFDGISATFLMRMWDSSSTVNANSGRHFGAHAINTDSQIIGTKGNIDNEFNAGVILGNRVIFMTSFLSRNPGVNTAAIATSLHRFDGKAITGRFKNSAIWMPASSDHHAINVGNDTNFNETVGAINISAGAGVANRTVVMDSGINGWAEDSGIDYVLLDDGIPGVPMSEGYEIRTTSLDPSINGVLPANHVGAAGNRGMKALVVIKRLF